MARSKKVEEVVEVKEEGVVDIYTAGVPLENPEPFNGGEENVTSDEPTEVPEQPEQAEVAKGRKEK